MSVQHMPVVQDSPAVAIARAHAEAWTNHDWTKAQEGLAADVHVTATTTQPAMPTTDLTASRTTCGALSSSRRPLYPAASA